MTLKLFSRKIPFVNTTELSIFEREIPYLFISIPIIHGISGTLAEINKKLGIIQEEISKKEGSIFEINKKGGLI